MTTKRTLIIFMLIVLSTFLVLRLGFFSNNGTTVNIRNHTNQAIENLVFSSNDNEEKHIIPQIDPHSNISFEYEIGGFNENAVHLTHISDHGTNKSYSIIGYVDWVYSYINIDIISINKDGELNIRIEAPR